MGRIEVVYNENQKEEIKKAYKKSRNVKERSRILCVKLRVLKGMSTKEISLITEQSESYINELIRKYTREGIESLMAKTQTSHNRNMTPEEEVEFLKQYEEMAIKGHILEVSKIIEDYEEVLNKKVAKSTVYDMLHRNGWRKIMPRSEHPKKASEEEIEAYKKTFWQSN